jgi:RNA polymerase sigma-B factor
VASAGAYRALSLHSPVTRDGDGSGMELVDLIGDVDHEFDGVEDRVALLPLLARLPAREQRIITLRFSGNLTQAQISAELGISQMHVSRLLSHALAVLRQRLTESVAPAFAADRGSGTVIW